MIVGQGLLLGENGGVVFPAQEGQPLARGRTLAIGLCLLWNLFGPQAPVLTVVSQGGVPAGIERPDKRLELLHVCAGDRDRAGGGGLRTSCPASSPCSCRPSRIRARPNPIRGY